MKIAGIIAEYNPFHYGHAHLIERTRDEHGGDATHIVAVMSGCFTQRGEPALTDPYTRAAAALQNGVDLVIQLPTPFALSSAQSFAEGGVYLLDALGCVDMISFGSECGDIDRLKKAAAVLCRPQVNTRMRGLMTSGESYAVARRQALCEVGGENRACLLDTPNNTLAIEYLCAVSRLESPMDAFTVARVGAAHDQMAPIGGTASASYLREAARSGRLNNLSNYMSPSAYRALTDATAQGRCPSRESLGERAVLARLRAMAPAELRALPAISEGLEFRLSKAIDTAEDLESLLEAAKTKRYPRTRLQRLVYNAFLGIDSSMTAAPPPYIHVLGANARGREILRAVKENGAKLPPVTRAAQVAELDERARAMYALECRAADLYAMFLPKPYPRGLTMTHGMIAL